MYYLGKYKTTYDGSNRYSIYTKDTLATSSSKSIEDAFVNYINGNFDITKSTRKWQFNPITKSMYEDATIYKCIFKFESLETFKDDYPEYFI